MNVGLLTRRNIWCPTLRGWILLLAIFIAPVLLWWFKGESYLSLTERVPAEILIVEGWLAPEELHAAGAEFVEGGYQYVVTTGRKVPGKLVQPEWTFAEIAERELIQAGVPKDRIIAAPATDNESTWELAAAVKRTLQDRGLDPKGVNVFTWGIHGRLSHLSFARALEPGVRVGVISWHPEDYESIRWWHSSLRARALISETSGVFYETFFGSRTDSKSSVSGSL